MKTTPSSNSSDNSVPATELQQKTVEEGTPPQGLDLIPSIELKSYFGGRFEIFGMRDEGDERLFYDVASAYPR